MSIICKLFGHRPAQGYEKRDGFGYFAVHPGALDGMGVVHANLLTTCCRCGAQYVVGKIHVPRLNDKERRAIKTSAIAEERARCLQAGDDLIPEHAQANENYTAAVLDYQAAIRGE